MDFFNWMGVFLVLLENVCDEFTIPKMSEVYDLLGTLPQIEVYDLA
jgi:hypothetical protein